MEESDLPPGSAAPAALPLVWTGRFDPAALPGARFGWQLTALSGRFTGPTLGLHFGVCLDRNYFEARVDGRPRILELLGQGARTFSLTGLGPGPHRFDLVKRSEGFFGSATLTALALAPGEGWLDPPDRPRYRLEVYGDSITAGACNEDPGEDQYDSLATHNALASYPALAAGLLGAEVVNIAVSGTGLTCSWNPVLMPEVFDRVSPDPEAPQIGADRAPHVVVVNLGQNDYGFPRSQGRPLSPDYGARLNSLVLALRRRYPEAWIVGALGGMTAVYDSEDLRRQWTAAWDRLGASDPRVRAFFFRAATANHPRTDTHALLAEELAAFLTREVWPHLEAPPH